MDFDATLTEVQKMLEAAQRSDDPSALRAVAERLKELEEQVEQQSSPVAQGNETGTRGLPRGSSRRSTRGAGNSEEPSASGIVVDITGASPPRLASSVRPTCETQHVPSTLTGDGRRDPTESALQAQRIGLMPLPESLSFAQSFADDDKPRLLFVIDALAQELRRERQKNKILMGTVIPTLTTHVQDLEKECEALRIESQELKAEIHHAATRCSSDPSEAKHRANVLALLNKCRELGEQISR